MTILPFYSHCFSIFLNSTYFIYICTLINYKNMASEFEKFAKGHLGISSLALDRFKRVNMAYGNKGLIQSAYINPSIIEERQYNVAVMDVFSRLMMDRIVFLGVPISDDVANIIQAQLLFLDSTDSTSDIQLYINSPGGAVYAGLGIYDTIQLVSSQVATICTGMAASMASVLLTAGEKGKRSALPHSRVMIHQPMGGAEGQASDIEITAREIVKLKRELYEIIAEHSGKSLDQIYKDGDRDYWMTAKEALEYGMIDEILTKASRENRENKKNSENKLSSNNKVSEDNNSQNKDSKEVKEKTRKINKGDKK